MRQKWRRHLIVTAFAAVSMLPFTGCSSQQQQVTDEVAAEGEEEGGDQSQGQEATAQGAPEAQGEATAQATPAEEGNPAAEAANEGANLATNEPVNAPLADNSPADPEVKEIISEMNGNPAVAAEEPVPAVEPAAAPEVASAPAPSGVPGMPEEGSKMPYIVEVGDTLSKIATKIHGDPKRWKDIATLSGVDNPNHIFPGDLVYYTLDKDSQGFASTYEGVKRGKESVQAGDTLASIAKRVYGSSSLWRHLWRQNDNIENPDKLTTGMPVYYVEKNAVKSADNKSKILHLNKTAKVLKAVKSFKTAKTTKTKTVLKSTLTINLLTHFSQTT
jgi:nucleoid-associated protein YgaU